MSLPVTAIPAEGLVIDLALKLDSAANLAVLARVDVEDVLREVAVVDLTQGLRHLRAALRLIDRAAEAIAMGGAR